MEAWGGLAMVALALVVAWLVTLSTIEALVLEEDGGYTGLTARVEEALEGRHCTEVLHSLWTAPEVSLSAPAIASSQQSSNGLLMMGRTD